MLLIERLGGRKFVLSMTVVILAFILGMLAHLTPEFTAAATVAVLAFNGANAFISGKHAEGGCEEEEAADVSEALPH